MNYVRESVASGELAGCESRRCTLFTFTREPSNDRWSTRIGGLPAWPNSRDWPSCEHCDEPLAFVAQFDFRNDPSVEFDLLLFHYCFACGPWRPDGASRVTLLRRDETGELVDEPVIPDDIEDNEPGPCFGIPHEIDDYGHPFCAMGSKIGGFPPLIQPIETLLDSTGNTMRFLACIGSLVGTDLKKIHSTPAVGDLMWGDVGCVYFWYSKNNSGEEVSWTMACY
ncbi:MAG: DUF1963 domain-containing protein [Planctomycetales bacterium]|nr:DUF1963 domain-containing protein [Planctomycetales bacterium]